MNPNFLLVHRNRYSEGMDNGQMTPRGYPNFIFYIKNLRFLVFRTDGRTDRNKSGGGCSRKSGMLHFPLPGSYVGTVLLSTSLVTCHPRCCLSSLVIHDVSYHLSPTMPLLCQCCCHHWRHCRFESIFLTWTGCFGFLFICSGHHMVYIGQGAKNVGEPTSCHNVYTYVEKRLWYREGLFTCSGHVYFGMLLLFIVEHQPTSLKSGAVQHIVCPWNSKIISKLK